VNINSIFVPPTHYTLCADGAHTLFSGAQSVCKGYSGDSLEIISNDKLKFAELVL
jgi:hypothetical protein